MKHGDARKGNQSPLYICWLGMNQRCDDKNYKRYRDWGGRGIRVLWDCYEDFKRDMGPSFIPGLQIERRDNNGHYSVENCIWTTAKWQALNRRSNIKLTHDGETLSVSQWSERTGIKRQTLEHRFHSGWDDSRIVSQPVCLGSNQYSYGY